MDVSRFPGRDGDERSDADELAALLPAGRFARVPGGHGDSFAAPEFGAVIKTFLGEELGRAMRAPITG